MAFQDVQYRGQCPICYREITLASIEPHINNSGLEIHTFKCERCGPIKSKIVAIPAQFAA
jgi:C4-type Zn-finger protein